MRIAILGAGVTGLVAAYRLSRHGLECDVYERWPGLGGQAATLDIGGGHLLERYYHHLFTSDRHIVQLYEELGMPDEVEWLPSSVAVFAEGRSWPFSTPLDLLRFSPMSVSGRVRTGAASLYLQRRGGSPSLEQVTAREWIRRWMGHDAWDKVWGPLLQGKFGARGDEVAMIWLGKKLSQRREAGGEHAKATGEVLGYPRSSWEGLFRRLQQEIEGEDGRVMIDRPAVRLARSGDGAFVVTPGAPGSFRRGHDPRSFEAGGEPEHYEHVVATVPSDVFDEMLDPALAEAIDPAYMERVRGVEYQSALCLVLELDRQFSPFYWTNVADPGLPFIGLIEHTNLVPADRYGDRRFLYVANYLPAGDRLLSLGADELLAEYEPGLRRVNPEFSREWVIERHMFREPAAQPVVGVGYRDRIPPLETGVPGLVLANTTQIFPEDRGTNYSVRLGEEAAHAVLAALGAAPVTA
ncbi:MAG: NAD(P)/FAD-dependent oxidoreductase [Gaiellaceae bacterium]